MTTTPLPPFPRPYVYDPGRFGVAYSQTQMVDFATQARADLEAENQRLREALASVHRWIDDQADAQSKGGHATFDLMMLREQRDIASAALENQP